MLAKFNEDVIVIGCGPAGLASAITCAKSGFRVLIIEEKQFPRYRPGETLHPGIEPLLNQLGVMEQIREAGFLRHKGNWVQWGSDPYFVPFGSDASGPWQGYQAWRADFDSILLNKAKSLGVNVQQSCRVIRPIISHNRVTGVMTSDGEIRSTFIIDATGRRQWLAKKLKLVVNRCSPRIIVRYGYMEGNCPVRNKAPSIVADENGWTWTARVRPQVYQWTRLSFDNKSFEKGWVPEEFKGLKLQGNISGADMTWRIVIPCAGFGYFLVGDAAAVLDPTSSHGVLKAIMSGMMAGHIISRISKNFRHENMLINGYRKWLFSWFKNDVRELKKMYGVFPVFHKELEKIFKQSLNI